MMKGPFRKIGNPEQSKIPIYIEDYVYTFLQREKNSDGITLVGRKDEDGRSWIWRAERIITEKTRKGMIEDSNGISMALNAVWQENTVKIKTDKGEYIKDYFLFYADNEPMKELLLDQWEIPASNIMIKQENISSDNVQENKNENGIKNYIVKKGTNRLNIETIWNSGLGLLILIILLCVTSINTYQGLMNFIKAVLIAAELAG
ncbi:MAG: hypothetical protein PHP50_04245 [Lachnospiraceae bacterium]|nr:hypothetical protein [Lachnospiraceae bacterium]